MGNMILDDIPGSITFFFILLSFFVSTVQIYEQVANTTFVGITLFVNDLQISLVVLVVLF